MQVTTFYKRAFLSIIALIMMMIVISGCASGASTPNTTQNISSGASAPTTTQATPTASSSGNVVVKTANATVGGKSESILTDTNGRTLYYFTPDTLHKVACSTGCVDTWPPLLFKGTGTVNADTKLPGDLTTDNNANGNQVVYNGHYLYTYSGDSAPGDTKGNGVGNKWYVATPDLGQSQSNPSSSGQAPTTGY